MDQAVDTRQRVLDSAAGLFAEKGYAATSLSEIAERAGANKASINYYFRSKENLYGEAWRMEFERGIAAHPLDGGVAPTAPAVDRLRGHILSVAKRIMDPGAREFDILAKERANPTGLLAEIMRRAIQPAHESLTRILTDLLGPDARPIDIRLCRASIMSQTIQIFLMERPLERAHHPPSIGLPIDEVVEHILRFSLAGVRDRRERIEGGEA